MLQAASGSMNLDELAVRYLARRQDRVLLGRLGWCLEVLGCQRHVGTHQDLLHDDRLEGGLLRAFLVCAVHGPGDAPQQSFRVTEFEVCLGVVEVQEA